MTGTHDGTLDWAPLLLSFQVAFAATAVCTVCGVVVGAALALPRFPFRNVIDVVLTTPLVLPPTVLGYYVLVCLGRKSVVGGLYEQLVGSPIVFTRAGAVVAAAVGAFPLVFKAARVALEEVDPTLVQAARTLGASPLRTFLEIQLPLAARGIVAGAALCFARSLGDFGVTLMVAGDIPGETQTAALAVYDAIQAHREADATMMIVVLSISAFVCLYAVNRLQVKPLL
jgi:molybdate transport system permease protein